MDKVNLAEKFGLFDEQWTPKIVAELNGQYVKLAKLEGAFVWHQHEAEDELFLVVKGRLTMKLRAGDVHLAEGEMLVIPRGVEHCPVAEEEAHVLLFEPIATRHTGNVHTIKTVDQQDWI
jgi:mannose-6-phosphate isomerase-like protein (cupin superfamily)